MAPAKTTEELMLINTYVLRGRILQDFIMMDHVLNSIISKGFISDPQKQMEFIECVMDMDVKSKRTLFQYLMIRDEFLTKKELNTLIARMEYVTGKRNQFAHWPVDLSESACLRYEQNKALFFGSTRIRKLNGKPEAGLQQVWSAKRIDELVEHINAVTITLLVIDKAYPLK